MKKRIINIVLIMSFFIPVAKAQQTAVQVILNADGSRSMNITDEAGVVTTISAPNDAGIQAKYFEIIKKQPAKNMQITTDQKPQPISHRAVLGTNGKQQIILTFASGKEIAIDAVEGQTIQQTYLAYLKKEGLNCACSSAGAAIADSKTATKTVTKSTSIVQ